MDDQSDFDVESLGDDVVVEILLRLPLKDVLRSRSVSKRWCSLTKTDHFIARHRRHYRQDPAIIFRHHDDYEFRLLSGCANEGTVLSSLRLHLSRLGRNICDIKLIGSSHGLVCIAVRFLILRNRNRVWQQVIIVWNRATQQYRELPQPNTPFTKDDIIYMDGSSANNWKLPIIGFYFVQDEDRIISSYHYKLARIFRHDNGTVSHVFRAQVLDRSKNSWKTAKNELLLPPCEILDEVSTSSITLNGVIYWNIVRQPGKYLDAYECCVISFDLSEEVFNVIDLPANLWHHSYHKPLTLTSWQNTLAVVSHRDLKIWVMNTSSDRPIWTLQFRFKRDVLGNTWTNSCFGFLKDDEFLIQVNRDNEIDLISYDPNTDTKYIINHGKRTKYVQKALNYIQTLAPV